MLDEGIVVIASVMIFWVLLIAPTIESNAGADTFTQHLSVAYPVMDLMLSLCSDRVTVPEDQIPAAGPDNAFGYRNRRDDWDRFLFY